MESSKSKLKKVDPLPTSVCPFCHSTEFVETVAHEYGTMQRCVCGKNSLNQTN